MSWRFGLALICVLLSNSSAQNSQGKPIDNSAIWEPPSVIDFPQGVKSSVPREVIKGLHVAGESIILDETILTAVQSHVGGTIGHRGDAGDSLEWLCLRGTGVQGPWVLWLMSWWKFTHGRVGGFRWQRVEPTAQFDSRCQTLPDGRGGVELPIALQLGIVQSQVLRILGQPSKRVGHTLLYRHEHEVTIKNQLFKTLNTMAVILRGQAVWATEAWRHGNHQQFEVLISAGR